MRRDARGYGTGLKQRFTGKRGRLNVSNAAAVALYAARPPDLAPG